MGEDWLQKQQLLSVYEFIFRSSSAAQNSMMNTSFGLPRKDDGGKESVSIQQIEFTVVDREIGENNPSWT